MSKVVLPEMQSGAPQSSTTHSLRRVRLPPRPPGGGRRAPELPPRPPPPDSERGRCIQSRYAAASNARGITRRLPQLLAPPAGNPGGTPPPRLVAQPGTPPLSSAPRRHRACGRRWCAAPAGPRAVRTRRQRGARRPQVLGVPRWPRTRHTCAAREAAYHASGTPPTSSPHSGREQPPGGAPGSPTAGMAAAHSCPPDCRRAPPPGSGPPRARRQWWYRPD
jgi:hypothetical protein